MYLMLVLVLLEVSEQDRSQVVERTAVGLILQGDHGELEHRVDVTSVTSAA